MSLTIELLLLLFWGCLKNVFPPDFIILRSRSPLPKFYLCLSWMRTAMFIQEGKIVLSLFYQTTISLLYYSFFQKVLTDAVSILLGLLLAKTKAV